MAYFNRTAIAAAKAGQGKKEKVDEDAARRVKVPMVEGNEMSGYLELMVIGEDVYLVCLSYLLSPFTLLVLGEVQAHLYTRPPTFEHPLISSHTKMDPSTLCLDSRLPRRSSVPGHSP